MYLCLRIKQLLCYKCFFLKGIYMKILNTFVVITLLTLTTACATNIHAPSDVYSPAKVKLEQFNSITYAPLAVAEQVPQDSSNMRAIAKIEEHMQQKLKNVFGETVFSDSLNLAQANADGTQLIAYTDLVDLKFVSGGARFMVGAMAGSSAVIVKLTIVNSATGEEVVNTSFYQKASAFSGQFGVADNKMLEAIVDDIRQYLLVNK
jgi:hypothetical protein